MNGLLGCLLLVLVGVTLLLHLNSVSEPSPAAYEDSGAWSTPTPTIGEAWISGPTATMACQEDEIIVGYGDFHSTGMWDAYACQVLDDVCENTWAAPEVCELAGERGYADGWTDHANGESFGGDK